MLRTTKAALLAVAMMAAAATTAVAQDQEAGDVRVDLPPRKTERRHEDEPEIPTRAKVGTPGPLRFYGGISIAVGGKRHEETSPLVQTFPLNPTLGFQGGAEYVAHKYFSIGGETRFLWAKIDGLGDRDFLWDIDIKPRGRYAFDKLPLEVYGALPIGLTVAGIEGPREGQVGFNVGLVGGATWWFNTHMGVNAELGWVFHKYGREAYDAIETDITMNQFLLLCPNFVYAL